jgi:hypothetical protein
MNWNPNPEPNVVSYQLRWATTLGGLSYAPLVTVVNTGFNTSYVISGFQPTDDVFVQCYAVDNGLNPDGSMRAPFISGPSNIFSRVVTEGGINTAFVLQTDLSNQATFVWNNVPSADHFELQIDEVPTFNSYNPIIGFSALTTINRFIQVEDLVLISQPYQLPVQRSAPVTWYWRVRPVYPGGVFGLWNTQVRSISTVLNGVLPVTIGQGTFIETSLVVSMPIPYGSGPFGSGPYGGTETFAPGVDYEFIAPNQLVRLPGSAIPDGATVTVVAELEQVMTVGVNRDSETRDRMAAFLDPLFYDNGSRTTTIFNWFDAVARGSFADYVIANRVMIQGLNISTTIPSELYERYGGMVTLSVTDVPIPDAYAAIQALYPAFLNGGTQNAIQLACQGLTGRGCIIQQGGTGAGTGWILHGDDGPPSGLPDFVFEDFPGLTLPFNTYNIILEEFDDIYNWNITVSNAARGVRKEVVRNNQVGLTDFMGVTNIVPGSLRLIDATHNTVDTGRYTVDYVNGSVTWNSPIQALPAGSVYTAICGVYFIDLIKRVFNEILPAHVNPIYTFQVQNLAQVLGLAVWEVSDWDTTDWEE